MEGPTAPVFPDLSEQLLYMNPHHKVQQQLEDMDRENDQAVSESREREEEEDVEIVPFTDSQLHALYHNVELEKNVEFVDHWLETQKGIEKFQLNELLLNEVQLSSDRSNRKRRRLD